jgi:hypothetical protein
MLAMNRYLTEEREVKEDWSQKQFKFPNDSEILRIISVRGGKLHRSRYRAAILQKSQDNQLRRDSNASEFGVAFSNHIAIGSRSWWPSLFENDQLSIRQKIYGLSNVP